MIQYPWQALVYGHGTVAHRAWVFVELCRQQQIDALRQGVTLSDGPTRPAEVTRLRDSGKYTHLEIVITEGRNRQVRRMLETVGSKVLKLVSVAIGPVRIGTLQIGKWRELGPEELSALSH